MAILRVAYVANMILRRNACIAAMMLLVSYVIRENVADASEKDQCEESSQSVPVSVESKGHLKANRTPMDKEQL